MKMESRLAVVSKYLQPRTPQDGGGGGGGGGSGSPATDQFVKLIASPFNSEVSH